MYIKKNWTYIGLTLFVLSGYVYVLFGTTFERVFLVASIGVLLLGIRKIEPKIKVRNDVESIVHKLFLLVFVFDSIIGNSIDPIIYGVGIWAVYWVSTTVIEYNIDEKIFDYLMKFIIVVSIIILFLSVVYVPVTTRNYMGFFGNSNGMGTHCASFSTVLLAIIVQKICDKSKKWLTALILGYLFSGYILIVSSSRTAFVILLLQLFVAVIICFNRTAFTVKKMFFIIIAPMIILMGVWLGYQIGLWDVLDTSVFEKFIHVFNQGDITNGRKEMWTYILEHAHWLEGGAKILDTTPHNIYIGLINQFGMLSGILYLIFILLASWRMLKYSLLYGQGKYRFIPVMAAINFLVTSMTENFLLTHTMILMYLCLSLPNKKGNKK